MQNDRVVIFGGLVLAHGETVARPADIVLEGDSIEAIVPPGTAEAARRIDATGRLIIPGLVNAHTHGHGGLAKGAGDRWSLELLLNAGPWLNGGRTGDDRYLSTLLTAAEMLRKGCTACYDLSAMLPVPSVEALHDAARAYADVGMRAVIAPMIADRTFYQAIPGLLDAFPPELRPVAEAMRAASSETILAPIREAARAWSYSSDQIRLGIAPTIPLHCSDEFMRGCRDLATGFGLPVQTHLAESPVQRAGALKQYGMTLTAHLERMGLIGPGFSGAHAIWIDDAEIELIARRGGTLAHNPGSNLRLGNGISDMRRAIAGGVTVGVGTDGSSSSDNQNMFEATRLAAYVSRVFDRAPEDWIGSAEALRMATEGSAAVLGMARDDREDRVGVQGGSGVPRSGSRQPGAAERRGEPVGERRGRGGGAGRDDRRAVRAEGRRVAGAGLAGDCLAERGMRRRGWRRRMPARGRRRSGWHRLSAIFVWDSAAARMICRANCRQNRCSRRRLAGDSVGS